MKVLVLSTMAPFVWGGAEELAVHLERNLIAAGHDAEVMRIPFSWEPATRIPTQMAMARLFELINVDRVIALKFPAYLVRHPSKVIWLLHQYRQTYDLWDSGHTNIPASSLGQSLRRTIHNADLTAFNEAQAIFTNSEVTSQRLMHYNGVASTVLRPPVNDPERFLHGSDGGYVFAGGRINGMKRQHLLVEALAHAPGARLVVAGPPDSQQDADRVREVAERLDLGERLTLDLRFLDREEYARYVREARAVAYVPVDEDSLGYVAMEGATAGKPILTATDSGGILGLVEEAQTGYVRTPDPAALGDGLAEIFRPRRAAELGERCRERWNAMGITWEHTIEQLTQ